MSRLRCHELDRRDELEMILGNREHPYEKRRRKELESAILEAKNKLADHDRSVARTDRWIRLLKDSLVHHWIDNPDAFITKWESENE